MRDKSTFVAFGLGRARRAVAQQIRDQVLAEFADELKRLNAWDRYWRRRHIESEINRRIELAAPRDALY